MIRAKNLSDAKWWGRNWDIIAYLDEGRPVGEIAMITARGQRHIRVVRERLADLRSMDRE